MNVFEHQRFRLRSRPRDGTPGEECYLSWAEIMTDEREFAPAFHYPLEYMNVAALGLCIGLTQAFMEPKNVSELLDRLGRPVSSDEMSGIVDAYRNEFGIDDGSRFMQGPEPERDKKGRPKKIGPLSELVPTIKKGDKEFLNRTTGHMVVRTDQIPILLASRSTFYEKSAGRGYLTGTSGDMEVRTYLIDPNSLRNTIWLNVLNVERQGGNFTPQGDSESGYDDWMWIKLPKVAEVPANAVSLRSALFWMVANLWVEIAELDEPGVCIVTGDVIPAGERAGIGAVVTSTGIGYGAKVERDNGIEVRQSFFVHPNGPWKLVTPKKGPSFPRHLEVDEESGLIGEMGGLFYASQRSERGYHLAPVVEQLYDLKSLLEDRDDIYDHDRYDLHCFGFHMLSAKKNVHGGYESELFEYPLLGRKAEERTTAMEQAEILLSKCSERTRGVADTLRQAVQRCIMKETKTKEDDGVVSFSEKERVSDSGLLRDVTRELWSDAGDELRRLIHRLGTEEMSADDLEGNRQTMVDEWTEAMKKHAERIFLRYFNDYSASPQHMLAAHDARRLFYARIWKLKGIE